MKLLTKTLDPDILLIEDNDDDAEIVQSIFKKNNIENILHIKTGEEALDYLLSKDGGSTLTPFPKLVMLDINLPGMNGLNVLRRMRANYKTDKLPVFVFTSSTSNQDTFEAYKFGVTSYISKHTSFEKFEEAIMQTEIYLHQYKVLILEDNFSDAEIISYELENSHVDCLCRIARNKAEYTKLLIEFKPDIVFADYDLPPNFDAIQAIRILKGMNLDIPFVLVTGKLAEEFATSCMVEGMDDYLLKGQLRRLPLTLINTLRKKKLETNNNDLIKKLQKSEEELKNKSRILTEAQRIAMLGNWKIDIASGYMTWSDEMYTIYGLTPDTFHNSFDAFLQFVHRDDKDSVAKLFKELPFHGKRCHHEFRIILNDGTIRIISCFGEPFYNEHGEITSYIGTAQDVTERKKYEKDLRDYKSALDQFAIVSITDQKGVLNYVNENFCRISKYSASELIGQDHRITNSGYHPKSYFKNLWTAIANGKIWKGEIRNKAKDGSFYWVDNAIIPFLNAQGKPYQYLSIRTDITERKNVEEEHMRLSNIIETTPDLVAIADIEQRFVYLNKAGRELTGYTESEDLSSKLITDFVTENTVHTLNETVIPTAMEAGKWSGEVALITKNGKEIPIWSVTLVHKNTDGKPEYISTIARDLTERKQAESKIREVVNRYEILAQATSDTIWDWNIVNNKMLYNDGITKMFGYQEVENTMDWWNEKLHPDDVKKVADSFQEVFEKKADRLQLTYRYRCTDGSYKYILDRACVLFDESGKPTRMIGAMQDITYQVEEEMRMTKAIIDAQEKERRFIGTELHDNVNQILAGAVLTFSMINKKIDNNINELVEAGTKHITHAINEIRKLSHKLVPATFCTLSLKDTFENLLMIINLSDQFSIDLQFDEIEKENISNDIKINLYRILQEQLNNIIKHADATAIEIAVTLQPGKSIKMRIRDNGKGFETINDKSGIGLNNMRKRVELLSGTFTINSAIGKGCEIIVDIPF